MFCPARNARWWLGVPCYVRNATRLWCAMAACALVGCPDASSEAPPPPPPATPAPTGPAAPGAAVPATPAAPAGVDSRHCDNRARLGACQEYPLDSPYLQALGVDMAESVCGVAGGTWGTGPCPADQRVGRCEGSQGELSSYYSVGERSFTAESAERACTSNDPPGTFLDG